MKDHMKKGALRHHSVSLIRFKIYAITNNTYLSVMFLPVGHQVNDEELGNSNTYEHEPTEVDDDWPPEGIFP